MDLAPINKPGTDWTLEKEAYRTLGQVTDAMQRTDVSLGKGAAWLIRGRRIWSRVSEPVRPEVNRQNRAWDPGDGGD